jgi:hypothetical protein
MTIQEVERARDSEMPPRQSYRPITRNDVTVALTGIEELSLGLSCGRVPYDGNRGEYVEVRKDRAPVVALRISYDSNGRRTATIYDEGNEVYEGSRGRGSRIPLLRAFLEDPRNGFSVDRRKHSSDLS